MVLISGYRGRDDIYQRVGRPERVREKISFQLEDRTEVEGIGGGEERYSTFTSSSPSSKKKVELIVNRSVRRGSGDQSESDNENEDGEEEDEKSASATMAAEASPNPWKEGGRVVEESHVVPKIDVAGANPSALPCYDNSIAQS